VGRRQKETLSEQMVENRGNKGKLIRGATRLMVGSSEYSNRRRRRSDAKSQIRKKKKNKDPRGKIYTRKS